MRFALAPSEVRFPDATAGIDRVITALEPSILPGFGSHRRFSRYCCARM